LTLEIDALFATSADVTFFNPSPSMVRIVGSLCACVSVYSALESNSMGMYSPRLNKTTSSLYAPL
jgi:hypothetical protein